MPHPPSKSPMFRGKAPLCGHERAEINVIRIDSFEFVLGAKQGYELLIGEKPECIVRFEM